MPAAAGTLGAASTIEVTEIGGNRPRFPRTLSSADRGAAGVSPSPGAPSPSPGQPDADSLEELLARVSVGEERAFERLYDLVAPRLFGMVLRVLRDPAQSEEVCQEVLLEVWRDAGRFDPRLGSGTTWLFTLAHRRAVDRVRSGAAAAAREERAALADVRRPHDEVAEQVSATLEREAVDQCLEQLTRLQREAVELAYWRGFTHREVARVLDVPLGTVKSRMRDGLVRLRDCLGVAR